MTYKVDIKKILNAIDSKNYEFLSSLSEEEVKNVNYYILLNYTSNINVDSTELEAWFLEKTNEYTNKNFWSLSKNHKELLWLLNCCIGVGFNTYHPYASFKKTTQTTNKFEKLLESYYPNMKLSDIKILATQITTEEKNELFDKLGFDETERKIYK
jgi:hypothetical protein